MAGDWLKVEHDLPEKPEVVSIACAVKIDCDSVVGKLFRVWRWFDRHTVDGYATGVTSAYLDALVAIEGFAAAMTAVGWLVQRNGSLSVPRFDRHISKSAKQRALGSERVKRSRNARSETKTDTVFSSLTSPKTASSVQEEARAPPTKPEQILEVFAHYRAQHPRAFKSPQPRSKEWQKIAARLAEGFSVDDLRAAIDGCHRSPFHCGQNDQQATHQSLELIVRDGSHVNKFINVPLKAPAVLSPKTQRSLKAAQQFMEET